MGNLIFFSHIISTFSTQTLILMSCLLIFIFFCNVCNTIHISGLRDSISKNFHILKVFQIFNFWCILVKKFNSNLKICIFFNYLLCFFLIFYLIWSWFFYFDYCNKWNNIFFVFCFFFFYLFLHLVSPYTYIH